MSKSLLSARTDVLRRLGDSSADVWSVSEINNYLIEGYDRFAIETRCFWDRTYLPDTAGEALSTLPETLYQVDRVTWNDERIEPMTRLELETDEDFETTAGPVDAYSIEYDGIAQLRRYRVPQSEPTIYDATGTWGIARTVSDILDETPVGQWGTVRQITDEDFSGSWGLLRYAYGTDYAVKVEYFRRGRTVSADADVFELPDIYVLCIRHYALWKALERDGPGQDIPLAEHYKKRWHICIQRVLRRKSAFTSQIVRRMGGSQKIPGKPPRPRLPWAYGHVVR